MFSGLGQPRKPAHLVDVIESYRNSSRWPMGFARCCEHTTLQDPGLLLVQPFVIAL